MNFDALTFQNEEHEKKAKTINDLLKIDLPFTVLRNVGEQLNIKTAGRKKSCGKEPLLVNWTWQPVDSIERFLTLENTDRVSSVYNIGLILGNQFKDGSYLGCIDIDCYENAEDYLYAVINRFGMEEKEMVYQKTASGGYHLIFLTDKDLKNKVLKLDGGKQIELRMKGTQIAVYPSVVMSKSGNLSSYNIVGNINNLPKIKASSLEDYFEIEHTERKLSHGSGTLSYESSFYINITESKKLLNKVGVTNYLKDLGLLDGRERVTPRYISLPCPRKEHGFEGIAERDKRNSFSILKDRPWGLDLHDHTSVSLIGLAFIVKGNNNYKEWLYEKYGIAVEDEYFQTDKSIKEILGLKSEVYSYQKSILQNYDGSVNEANRKVVEDFKLDLQHDILIIGLPGCGKTYLGHKEFDNHIFASPYEATVKQNMVNYKVKGVYGQNKYVPDQKPVDVYEIVKSETKIGSTYDGIKRIFEAGYDPKGKKIIIDEAHDPVSQITFRPSAIQSMIKLSKQFDHRIFITATPWGSFEDSDQLRVITFEPLERPKPLDYRIVSYEKQSRDKLISHIIKNPVDGIIWIYIDNKRELEKIKKSLCAFAGFEENSIAILDSDNKNNETFKSIINNEMIPGNIKVVLSTKLVSDGVNIKNKNIDAVYLVDALDLNLVIQFTNRFREGAKVIYDFVSFNEPQTLQWIDYNKMVSYQIKVANALKDSIETVYYARAKFITTINLLKSDFKEFENYSIYKDPDTGLFEVNENEIRNQCLNILWSITNRDVERRIEYLQTFGNYNIVKQQVGGKLVDTKAISQEVNELFDDEKTEAIKLLEAEPNKYVTTVAVQIETRILESEFGYGRLFNCQGLDTKKYLKEHKEAFNPDIAVKITYQYLELISTKVSHKTALSLLKIPSLQCTNAINRLKAIYFYLIKTKASGAVEFSSRSTTRLNYELLSMIISHLNDRETFDSKVLVNEVNQNLSKLGIKKEYTSREIMDRVNLLYGYSRKHRNIYKLQRRYDPKTTLSIIGVEIDEIEGNEIEQGMLMSIKSKLNSIIDDIILSGGTVPEDLKKDYNNLCPDSAGTYPSFNTI